ncbi:LigA [Nocardioidaceae bacterium Broad-1]|nr:LigA [Nocardioidaceae bacterium Broad-1]
MLIAEDLVLLMLEDLSGRPVGGLDMGTLDLLVGGALVSELALSGAVHLVVEPVGGTMEVHPTGVRVPADPCLQRSLVLAGGRARPAPLVRSCGIQMFAHIADRLVHRGLLRGETERRHLITRTIWPATEISYKQDVRHHLTAALFHGAQPSRRTATLIGLIAAADQVDLFFPSAILPLTEVRRRADHIAAGDWAATTVRGILRASRRRRDWFGGGDGGGFFGGEGGDGGGGGGDGGGGGG